MHQPETKSLTFHDIALHVNRLLAQASFSKMSLKKCSRIPDLDVRTLIFHWFGVIEFQFYLHPTIPLSQRRRQLLPGKEHNTSAQLFWPLTVWLLTKVIRGIFLLIRMSSYKHALLKMIISTVHFVYLFRSFYKYSYT